LSEYNSNPLKKGSLRKCPYFHIGHWEELKGGTSSDDIEGEMSHLANPIFSSMTTLDVLSKPISQPILDPDDPSYALSPKSHDDPRNPLRHSQSIGVMKIVRMTKKSNNNGWRILRTGMCHCH